MALDYIPLEQPIADVEQQIDELRRLAADPLSEPSAEIKALEKKSHELTKQLFKNLTAYQTAQMARHPRRPNALELIELITTDFVELHGDRNFQDDKAIVGGPARIDDHSVILIGHQKGRGTKDNIFRNFGMPRPEGYRKALRLMTMAERFRLPIVTFIDTPGAYPGVGAEERGQSEAIAKNIMVMAKLTVPIVSVVVGEGGSGGALALGVANKVYMMEHAIYSVISPEGCASILFSDASKAPMAAEALQLTAAGAKKLDIIDGIIEEPFGGAHRHPGEAAASIKKVILTELQNFSAQKPEDIRTARMERYRAMGSKHIHA